MDKSTSVGGRRVAKGSDATAGNCTTTPSKCGRGAKATAVKQQMKRWAKTPTRGNQTQRRKARSI